MQVSDFNYDLPQELIAQVPIKNRDESRLMVLDRKSKTIDHKIFNISPFRPEHPLDDASQWHTTNRDSSELYMSSLSVDIFCQKIEAVCDKLGYSKRMRAENKEYLKTLVSVR